MQMNDNAIGGVFLLSIGTLFFASVTLCIRTGYKKKNDSVKCSCCGMSYEATRNVKVEEDIELGSKGIHNIGINTGGSTDISSEYNSEFNSESRRI